MKETRGQPIISSAEQLQERLLPGDTFSKIKHINNMDKPALAKPGAIDFHRVAGATSKAAWGVL